MITRRANNNHERDLFQDENRNSKADKYADENLSATDSDAAEANPAIKQASQESGNNIEEGDEDYDDEAE